MTSAREPVTARKASGARTSVVALFGLALAACVSTSPPDKSKTAEGRAEAAGFNLRLGAAYLQQNNLPSAKEILEKAETQNPDSADIHSMLALLQERLGDNRKADAEHRTALRLAPQSPDVQNNYAVFLCRTGKATDGVKYFEAAAANRLYRTPWAAYTNAGVCLRNANRNDDAMHEFQLALNSNPVYAEAVYQSAEMELLQGKLLDARVHVTAWLLQNKPTPEMLQLAWRIATAQSDAPAAAQLARRLQNEFPDSPAARSVVAATP
jgi:type IV pilus assembly protein PilF